MSRWDLFRVLLLALAVVTSGVAVVWMKNQSRQLFVDLQKVRASHELASMEWGQLQLELANVGGLEDVMGAATGRLHMREPGPADIVVIER